MTQAPASQLLVVIEREGVGRRMRLVPVLDDGEPVAAVNAGLGIVPLEDLGEGEHRALSEVYPVFRRLELATGDGDDRLTTAFALWRAGLARSDIELRLERRALYGARLPHRDWKMDAPGVSLRPWDVELTALAARLREVVKLDRVRPDLVETLRGVAAQRGLQIEIVEPPGRAPDTTDPVGLVTLLVGHDASALSRARDVEAQLLLPGNTASGRTAALEMGALLGYPACCVDRFARIAEQNDTTLAWALLPGVPHPPASPLTQWLQPGLALLSHAPCDLDCAASAALGARILEAVDARQPEFAARWRALAFRVQVVDHHSNRLALAVDGALETGGTVTAVEVLADGGSDPEVTTRAQRLVGRVVSSDSGGIVAAGSDWYAPYVADHRGRP